MKTIYFLLKSFEIPPYLYEFLTYDTLTFRATINNFSRGVVNQKRFYTRETLGGIMISLLAKIPTLYRDWLSFLK